MPCQKPSSSTATLKSVIAPLKTRATAHPGSISPLPLWSFGIQFISAVRLPNCARMARSFRMNSLPTSPLSAGNISPSMAITSGRVHRSKEASALFGTHVRPSSMPLSVGFGEDSAMTPSRWRCPRRALRDHSPRPARRVVIAYEEWEKISRVPSFDRLLMAQPAASIES